MLIQKSFLNYLTVEDYLLMQDLVNPIYQQEKNCECYVENGLIYIKEK